MRAHRHLVLRDVLAPIFEHFHQGDGMCSTVSLMQETNNRFLILKYNVANLGELKFYLASKQQG